MADKWRLIYNPEGDVADLFAYPSSLVEGRVAGKYLLASGTLPDTIVVQGIKKKGILAGADVRVDRETAKKNDIDVAAYPRSGRGGAKMAGTISLKELLLKSSKKFTAEAPDPDKPSVLLYTSGTTGKPKGVMLSFNNFMAESRVVEHVLPVTQEDRIIAVLPMFHVYAMADALLLFLYFGCSMIMIPQYSPKELLRNISDLDATLFIGIPSMYIHLLQFAKSRNVKIPKSLRYSLSGGAPLPLSVIKEFEEVFQTTISEGYGLTETTSCASLNTSGEGHKTGSIGPAAPGVEMKVFDEDDKELKPGDEGEIVIRGGIVTKGYYNLPDETEEAMRNGWFHTGDMGYMDEDGYFFITDRKKDIIIRGGFNISPREVEETLFTHSKVLDAAVIGVPDKSQRETVKAFVVLKEGESAEMKEIIDFCKDHLSPFKVPKFVEFRETLPKSATGKILRKELRDGYKDERLIEKDIDTGEYRD
jgi:long-chain acyl-CoA synthetase